MDALLALIGSLLVAGLGIIGQFFISNRNLIPRIREERALAYSAFLGACLTGMYAVTIDKQITIEIESEFPQYRVEDEEPMREHVSERLMAYNSEIGQNLARMQIVTPKIFSKLGTDLILLIGAYHNNQATKEEMDEAYSNFISRAHADLASLNSQAVGFRNLFTRKVKELEE
jgi:hypothetical protein